MLSSRWALSRHTVPSVWRSAARSLSGLPSVDPKDAPMDDCVFAYNTPEFKKTNPADLAREWDDLGFSIRCLNSHVKYTWKNGAWDNGILVPAPYILLHINAGALHYGVSVFEGMKAFSGKDGMIRLSNPDLNAARMQKGAERLMMPTVPPELFTKAVKQVVCANREFVPPYGHNAAMYIRPLLFASGPMLGLGQLAQEYTFFVTALPAGGYFGTSGEEVGMDALVCEDADRAAPRGLGDVKAAGNYAADLKPLHEAKDLKYGTTLYLDAMERKFVEEFSVCNFVGITHSGVYVTPQSDSILASTTNRMLMRIAKDEGLVVEERPVDFDAEIDNFKEIGMCGTATVLVKVRSITRGDTKYEFNDFATLARLRSKLTAIQFGDSSEALTSEYMTDVCPAVTADEMAAFAAAPLEMEASIREGGGMGGDNGDGRIDGLVKAEAIGVVTRISESSSLTGDSGTSKMDKMYGRERALLAHVMETAVKGSPESVLESMDQFWQQQFEMQGTHTWNLRSQIVDEVMSEKEPRRCLELGTYCGYSSLRIANALSEGSKLVTVEWDPLFSAIALKIIKHAGLDHMVHIVDGTVVTNLDRIVEELGCSADGSTRVVDLLLCDHSKDQYVPDIKSLESAGLVGQGTVVVGDTTVYPGEEETASDQALLIYLSASKKHHVQRHHSTEGFGGITVAEWVHLP